MKWSVLLTLLFTCSHADAQYYYKDIISNKSLLADMKAYRENKIRKIIINSFESTGEPSEGFYCEKRISRDYREVSLFTRSAMSGSSLFVSQFNDQGQLTGTTDSSDIMVSRITYQYDDQGRITHIISQSRSHDDDFLTELMEEHLYEFDAEGRPARMFRIKNQTDSTLILFQLDDQQNISIEKDTKTGGKYYYYYDNKNRLSDIVHMNEYKQQMIPDYQFEYNNAGQLVQMISTEEGGMDYLTWKYLYEDGLRTREKVFGKDRKLLGSIEYEYKK